MLEKEGVKIRVVSTGEFKGAFAFGTKITDAQLKDLQSNVDDLNELFLAAIMDGRDMSAKDLNKIADGRVFIAAKAQGFGLIDAVENVEDAMSRLRAAARSGNNSQRARFMINMQELD